MVNRKITNTAISRDVKDALAAYSIPVLNASIAQRVVFAEASAAGKAVYEVGESPAANEIEALKNELMEFAA